MKKFFICLKSIFVLLGYKILYGKYLIIKGIPVSVGFRNLDIYLGGVFLLGKRLNVYGNSELVCLKGGNLEIGDAVFINNNCNIVCRNYIKIGSHCRFGPNVCVYDHDHIYGYEGVTDNYKLGKVEIGKGCWLGANSVILRDSHIGEGSVIGAGVVVKGDVPPHSVVYNNKNNVIIKQIK